MKADFRIYTNLAVISAVSICFEILATRISSVIFVCNYAFMILSLAILGLGCGGIFAYYQLKTIDESRFNRRLSSILISLSASLVVFILAITSLKVIANPLVYFLLLFLPFFFAGIFYSVLFRLFDQLSFKLYAADLAGAAFGAIAAIAAVDTMGGSNGVLLLSIIVLGCGVSFLFENLKKQIFLPLISLPPLLIILLMINGGNEILSPIPIGNFPEKDFHYVYSDPTVKNRIIDSRWSIYGRADLVAYSHQNIVRQMFIDGAAGTQMFRFEGDKRNPSPMLTNLLIRYSTAIPMLFLDPSEKNSMLVIGPGGGKEVLTGLLSDVDEIYGAEINPDFVQIVKDHGDFNGGIYTEFPNVHIMVSEGRHYIKQTSHQFDLIVMALPSTEQLQNIGPYAMSENYLLTVEAIQDYLSKLTPEGRLVFTLHNSWELIRLIVSTLYAFEKMGVSAHDAINHFMVIEQDYSPTIVIQKEPFTDYEVDRYMEVVQRLPEELPSVTYLPFNHVQNRTTSEVNHLLSALAGNRLSLKEYIKENKFNITPCFDESPYFYHIQKGVPSDLKRLLIAVLFVNVLVITIPFIKLKKKKQALKLPLFCLACLGIGFMILEVSMFQKLILYLGSPTISLSIMLSSLLVSMGIGSYTGNRFFTNNPLKRIRIVSLCIVVLGSLIFFLSQKLLFLLLTYGLLIRILISIILILPLGFFLGMMFPSCIQMLKSRQLSDYIPWMYGINGTMSVLGSVLAVILAMTYGFSISFHAGLLFYVVICGLSWKSK